MKTEKHKARICLDTNVWISGLAFFGAPAEIIKMAFNQEFRLVLSSFILVELERNLTKKFSAKLNPVSTVCDGIAEIADLYEPLGDVDVVPNDHVDNLVLETAWLGRAQFLVTGDKKHLLPLKEFRGVKIISPADFLQLYSTKP